MTTKPIGLYVHVPFCVKKCNYCDFCSYPYEDLGSDVRDRYLNEIVSEIESYGQHGKCITVDTVFFGGGTPSLLRPSELERIFVAIRKSFNLLETAEITLEATPGTINAKTLSEYKTLGVNRLSIGLQSIHENELKKLGRIHSFDDFLKSYCLARECGFDNVSVDLMYGIPDQTVESFSKTLDKVISLAPEHISAYGLIIEAGTPFYSCYDRLSLPSEDAECDMYEFACDKLRRAGYSHYEISNYAKIGRESRHNLHYWRDESYIGVGVAAYSYFNGRRFSNPDNINDYLKDRSSVFANDEGIDGEAFEYAMLALRLAEGISLSDYERRFGRSFLSKREEKIKRYVDLGYMSLNEDRLAFTESGFYVSNSLLAELL